MTSSSPTDARPASEPQDDPPTTTTSESDATDDDQPTAPPTTLTYARSPDAHRYYLKKMALLVPGSTKNHRSHPKNRYYSRWSTELSSAALIVPDITPYQQPWSASDRPVLPPSPTITDAAEEAVAHQQQQQQQQTQTKVGPSSKPTPPTTTKKTQASSRKRKRSSDASPDPPTHPSSSSSSSSSNPTQLEKVIRRTKRLFRQTDKIDRDRGTTIRDVFGDPDVSIDERRRMLAHFLHVYDQVLRHEPEWRNQVQSLVQSCSTVRLPGRPQPVAAFDLDHPTAGRTSNPHYLSSLKLFHTYIRSASSSSSST